MYADREAFKLAKIGHEISKYCKAHGCSRISRKFYTPFQFSLRQIILLEQYRLAVYENCADLDQIGLAYDKQKTWNLRDWDNAIRKACKLEIEEYATDQDLILARNGYKITPAKDGGWWFQHYNGYCQYYRRRGWAIRRAMKEINA